MEERGRKIDRQVDREMEIANRDRYYIEGEKDRCGGR